MGYCILVRFLAPSRMSLLPTRRFLTPNRTPRKLTAVQKKLKTPRKLTMQEKLKTPILIAKRLLLIGTAAILLPAFCAAMKYMLLSPKKPPHPEDRVRK